MTSYEMGCTDYLELGNIKNYPGSNDVEKLANAICLNKNSIKGNFFTGHCECDVHSSFVGVYNPYLNGYIGLIMFTYFQVSPPKYITIINGTLEGYKEL
ncbi:MAG: hypothetical protein ACLUVC_02100 [Longibaculum sp.]